MKKYKNFDETQPPDKTVYFNTELVEAQDSCYMLGRAVAVLCRLKAQVQGRSSVHSGSVLRGILGQPTQSFVKLFQDAFHHIDKREKGWWADSYFNRQLQEIISDYQTAGIRDLPEKVSPKDKLHIMLGFSNQQSFMDHDLEHIDWKKANKTREEQSTQKPAETQN